MKYCAPQPLPHRQRIQTRRFCALITAWTEACASYLLVMSAPAAFAFMPLPILSVAASLPCEVGVGADVMWSLATGSTVDLELSIAVLQSNLCCLSPLFESLLQYMPFFLNLNLIIR
jgi:hypothetical protein